MKDREPKNKPDDRSGSGSGRERLKSGPRSRSPEGAGASGSRRRFADNANGYGTPGLGSHLRHFLHLALPFIIIAVILAVGVLVVVFLMKRDTVAPGSYDAAPAQRVVRAGPEALVADYIERRGGMEELRSRSGSLRSLGGVVFEDERRYLFEGQLTPPGSASFLVEGSGLVDLRLQSVDGLLSGANSTVNIRLLDPGLRSLLGLLSEYYDPLERIALGGTAAGRIENLAETTFGETNAVQVSIVWPENSQLSKSELYLESGSLRIIGRRDRLRDGSEPLFRFSKFRLMDDGREAPASVHVELGGGLAARVQISRVSGGAEEILESL